MSRKGQFAVEHILTIAFAMLILIPVTYMFYTYSDSQSNDLIYSRVNSIGNKIVDNSQSIYYLGEPSKITLKENFPEKIKDIRILEGTDAYELVFNVTDENIEMIFLSEVPIAGPYHLDTNTLCKDVVSGSQNPCYSAGMKRIKIVAREENASIIIS